MTRSEKESAGRTKKGGRKSSDRLRVSLSFSPEELKQIEQGAGSTPLARWCKERVLLSDGFGDPTSALISQGLMAADALRQYQYLYIEVFELGYQIVEALHDRPSPRLDARLGELTKKLDQVLSQVCADHAAIQASAQALTDSLLDLRRMLAQRPIDSRSRRVRRS